MNLYDIQWPIYVLHSDEVEIRDGLLFCDTQIVDDKNMKGKTLGTRRLQSPHKNLYPLRYMIKGFDDFVHHKGLMYIDSSGKHFRWVKKKICPLISHEIEEVRKKDIISLIKCKGIDHAFERKRPPTSNMRYASILYIDKHPSVLYGFTETKQRKTWRKI